MKLYCEKCRNAFAVERSEAQTEAACPVCGESIALPQEDVGPGVVLGDFLIKNVLGNGGMGVVYLAHQLSLDRDVALKVLQNKHSDDQEYVESLYREARAAAKINHPNVVQAYAIGEEDGVFYFAMELVRGNTFKEILKQKGGKLELKEAVKVIRDVSRALSVAWKEQQLVHQDIKPDNIMLDASGFAKLADLGLAKTAGSVSGDDDSNEVLGTPQYISPEQLTGVPTDVRSDIYSLGATFYQFVTGRFAYVASNIGDLPRLHVEGNLEPPKNVNPELPDAINDIIVKMMARQPENRYQTPDELIADLEKYMHDSAAPAAPQAALPGALRMGKPVPGGVPQLKIGGAKPALRPGATPARPMGAKPAALNLPGGKAPSPATGGLALNKPAMQKATSAAKPAAATPAVPKPVAAPAVPKPVAAPAVPKPVATPAVPKPVATPAAPKPVATPAAPKPVATPAAPKPVATPAAVAVKPAAGDKQPAVKPPKDAAPKSAKAEENESNATGVVGKIFKGFFLTIAIILILVITFVATVVVLKKMDKLPKFLSRTERFMSNTAEKAKDKAIELAQAPEVVQETVEAAAVTRPEYLQKVDELIQLSKSDVSGKKLLPAFDEAYPMLRNYQTPEEQQAYERLMQTICASDEELRCVPSRNALRTKYRKKLLDARAAARKKKLEEERQLRLAREQEEANRKSQAELERKRVESAKVAKARYEELKKNVISEGSNLAEAMIKSIVQNNPEFFAEAKAAVENFVKYAIAETMEERALIKKLQDFIKAVPAEMKKLTLLKNRLGAISPNHALYITLEDGAMVLIHSIRPGQITCLLDDGSKRTLLLSDLEEKSRTSFCNGLNKRFKKYISNSAFFIAVLDQFVDDFALKDIPKGFWKNNWEFFAPVLKK